MTEKIAKRSKPGGPPLNLAETAPAGDVSSKVQIGYPHQSTLVWGIPLSGRNLPPRIMFSFHNVLPPMSFNTALLHTWRAPIDEARNYFADEAIRHGAKYLFFWDEDVDMPPQTLRELIFMAEHHPEAAVIGGIYCLKVDRPEPLVFRGVGKGPYWDWRVGEIFEVDAIGMGCTLIRVDVFQDIPKPWFRTVDNMDRYLDNVRFGEQWSEDLYFCKKVRDSKKWKILAHGQLLPAHIDLATGREYTLPVDSKPMRPITAMRGQKKILDIGAGRSPLRTNEGRVVTLDIREETQPDYRCDFRKLPFATGEFDMVYSSHTLEHCDRKELEAVLDEWIRVLHPKGELRLSLPSLRWAAKQILKSNGSLNKDTLNVLYGEQDYPENFHRIGFTPGSINQILTEKGFVNQVMREEGYHVFVSAWRYPKAPKKRTRAGRSVPHRKGNGRK